MSLLGVPRSQLFSSSFSLPTRAETALQEMPYELLTSLQVSWCCPCDEKRVSVQVLKKAAFVFQALEARGTSACRPWPSSALRKGSCSKGFKTFHRYPRLDLREVSLKSPCSSLVSFRGPCCPKPEVPHSGRNH